MIKKIPKYDEKVAKDYFEKVKSNLRMNHMKLVEPEDVSGDIIMKDHIRFQIFEGPLIFKITDLHLKLGHSGFNAPKMILTISNFEFKKRDGRDFITREEVNKNKNEWKGLYLHHDRFYSQQKGVNIMVNVVAFDLDKSEDAFDYYTAFELPTIEKHISPDTYKIFGDLYD
jgi:hypothetical protein